MVVIFVSLNAVLFIHRYMFIECTYITFYNTHCFIAVRALRPHTVPDVYRRIMLKYSFNVIVCNTIIPTVVITSYSTSNRPCDGGRCERFSFASVGILYTLQSDASSAR